jgi:hypothetical protein
MCGNNYVGRAMKTQVWDGRKGLATPELTFDGPRMSERNRGECSDADTIVHNSG